MTAPPDASLPGHSHDAPLSEERSATETSAAGDPIPAQCEVIEVRVAELRQLFNPIDPISMPDRDLDARVEEFIVSWSREVPRHVPLALLVRLDHPAGPGDEAGLLRDTVHKFFAARAQSSERRLRRLFSMGRISLGIGLSVLIIFTSLAQLFATRMTGGGFAQILREGLAIGGWVAMWRLLEIFLYDWWPIRSETKLFDRLSAMPVRISYEAGRAADQVARERFR